MACKKHGNSKLICAECNENYRGSVIVVQDEEVVENIPFKSGIEAEKLFLDICENYLSNFDEYTKEDIEVILENGYEIFGKGRIQIFWF